ncbi:MAG TPA: GAP family protein [Acidimicrobiales bacterium]|nr:GAP family protein [Acidimicrobiales bacterium]
MSEALRESIPMAVVIAIFPVPIIAVVLLLTTKRARLIAPLFVTGWVVGLGAVGAIILAVADAADASESGSPATWVAAIKLAIAVALLVIGWRQYQSRPRAGESPHMPRWMGGVEVMPPHVAVATGVALAVLNPKNLLLAAAGAASIAQTGISGVHQALAYAVFVLIASCGVAIPVVAFFALGDRALPLLEGMRDWMTRNMALMVSLLCVLIACKLIWDAVEILRA